MAETGSDTIPDAGTEKAAEVESKTSEDTKQTPTADTVASNGDATKTEGSGDAASTEKPKEMKKELVVDENLKAKIVKQIEYYFGDLNLSRDRFLKEQVQLDDGWVPSERMLKFNRLKTICSEWSVITQALKELSELMEVSEDGLKVRRSPSKPLPGDSKERRDEVMARSVYSNRFPLDSKLDDLMLFFESFGPVEHVHMKRDFHKHTFKGSVFTTFKNKEDAEKFINDEGTTFVDTKLEVKQWKSDYFKSKPEKKKEAAKKLAAEKNAKSEENKLLNDKEAQGIQEKKDREEGRTGKTEEVDADDEEKVKQQMTKGAVLHISGMSQETDREDVRRLFLKHGDVSWVDFDKGVTEGSQFSADPRNSELAIYSRNRSAVPAEIAALDPPTADGMPARCVMKKKPTKIAKAPEDADVLLSARRQTTIV
ncbi:lupus La protein [Elysia marginata]|uniref:Lupus La protein n=1 Tax=Elysia marginata TaxID=1093978 RepID=A0AAV4G1R7_9GAST|nr:lupus La protein [Elysia marginata]